MSGYLTDSIGSTGSRKTFTVSVWVKIDGNTVNQTMFGNGTGGSNSGKFYFAISNGQVRIGGGANVYIVTNRLFRDPASWYHLVCAVDTTQATAENRIKFYVNGVQETDFNTSTYPGQNDNTPTNDVGTINTFGAEEGGGESWDGYMTHMVMVDGTQLTPSNFGETDSTTGEWKPKAVPTGVTYGTNGAFLKCENSANFGVDSSGQGNNYTSNSFPTGAHTQDTASNTFATFNSLANVLYAQGTLSEGNLKFLTTQTDYSYRPTTIGVDTGKWYWEIKAAATSGGNDPFMIGITSTEPTANSNELGHFANDWGYNEGAQYRNNNTNTSYGTTYTVGDIIGVALDLDNNKLYFSKNGTWQNSGVPTSGATGTGAIAITAPGSTPLGNYFPAVGDYDNAGGSSSTFQANFGNPPFSISSGNADDAGYGTFEYDVPAGYYSLCSKNLNTYG